MHCGRFRLVALAEPPSTTSGDEASARFTRWAKPRGIGAAPRFAPEASSQLKPAVPEAHPF